MSDSAAPAIDGLSITLSKPVNVLGTPTVEMKFREPVGDDLAECGYPTRFDAKGGTMIDAQAMTRMMARLAGVPESAVRQMAARDWNRAALRIAGFLGGGEADSAS